MATQLDLTALTLNNEEATSVTEIIIEKEFEYGMLSAFHDVQQGIHRNRQIVFLGRMGDVGKLSTGCTPNTATGPAFSDKTWTPKTEDFRLEHCAADVPQLQKFLNRASRMNPDFYNALGRDEIRLVVARVGEALTRSVNHKLWFGDTAAADFAGGGSFTNGTDVALYNVNDGLFKQLDADANMPKVSIAVNGNGSYAAQALADGDAETILREVYEAADARLLGDPGAQFLVTRTIWDNWMKSVEDIQKNGGFVERMENGMLSARFRGIRVVLREDWDRFINANQNNGTAWVNPHRVYLMTPDNNPLGTVNEADFSSIDSFYDRTLKQNIIDCVYTWDVKLLESYLGVYAV